ncbi:mechanosensitive ion channel family protein [Pedobacter nyackensis]|uniref:mechanosensitive ion channel family protein n=1 Tax=Pedobacter nyackensis TaxID=475255 RepID=UPI00292E1A0C|nr:mechanosensitive ion channel domain-containing protein [Pedobacter nyackensis]
MKYLLLLVSLLWVCTIPASAQKDSIQRDSAKVSPLIKKLREIRTDDIAKSSQKFKEEKNASKQRAVLQSIRDLNHQVKLLLKKAIDTNNLNEFLRNTQRSLEVVKEGIWLNPGSSQTQRNLAVSSAILVELSSRVSNRKQFLDDYANKLRAVKYKIDSLSNDPSIYAFPEDSVSLIKFAKRIFVAAKETAPLDSALEKATANLEELQIKTDLIAFGILSAQEDIDIYSARLSSSRFEREFPNLWDKAITSRPLGEILSFSVDKESILLQFYFENHQASLLILLVLMVCCWYFLNALKQQLKQDDLLNDDYSNQLVIRYPVLSSILITLSIFQFIFPSPPFIFSLTLWIISAICLWIIFRGYITNYWLQFWTTVIILFVLASVDNMVLQASRPERYIMLVLSLAGAIYAAFILATKQRFELKEKKIKYAIVFLLALQLFAILFNVFGRFNVAKTLMVTGYIGILTAIIFLWTIRLINEGLTLASKVYKQPSAKFFYVNFTRVGENAPWPFYLVFVLGWLTLIARNFYSFKRFSGPFMDFLTSDRSIGNYTYSITSLLLFILILFCAFVLSRLVSYFASEPDSFHQNSGKHKKSGLGSWLLIIRILIITIGLFFAFAAAGIPLDKFAIVLGALGVGIGLGLQGLVNNLISGLIISFERPVNVGDIIEVNGKIATMKSIGFRSSIVSSSDGPNVIIPNGELLSQQLVNYSMGKNIKRCSLIVGVAYNTNLEHARDQIKLILKDDERILQYPESDVFFKEFGTDAIEIEVIYWVRNIKEYFPLRSDLISRINTAFNTEGIMIPFAQHDVYIKNMQPLPDQKPST